jgi:hypothetical protein
VPAENASPERALGLQVGRVENDHLAHHVHDTHPTGVSAGRVTLKIYTDSDADSQRDALTKMSDRLFGQAGA